MLEKGELNHTESLELARPVLQQGRKRLLERENKVSSRCFLLLLNPSYSSHAVKKIDKIVSYSKKVSYWPEPPSFSDILQVVDILMSQNMIQPATSFLLDALKDNKPEQGPLQTRLLEMKLVHVPQVADSIKCSRITIVLESQTFARKLVSSNEYVTWLII